MNVFMNFSPAGISVFGNYTKDHANFENHRKVEYSMNQKFVHGIGISHAC